MPDLTVGEALGDVVPLELNLPLLPDQVTTETVSLTMDADQYTADIVFIADASGSMQPEEFDWMGDAAVAMDTLLEEAGITDNRFVLMDFARNHLEINPV